MDTTFADGATDLLGVLPILARSEHARTRLLETLEPNDCEAAVEMLLHGELTGSVGDTIHDFFLDEIQNEAEAVWSGSKYYPNDAENPDRIWPLGIREYCGVFFVWALEYDNVGYFHSKEDALRFAMNNWDHVRPDA